MDYPNFPNFYQPADPFSNPLFLAMLLASKQNQQQPQQGGIAGVIKKGAGLVKLAGAGGTGGLGLSNILGGGVGATAPEAMIPVSAAPELIAPSIGEAVASSAGSGVAGASGAAGAGSTAAELGAMSPLLPLAIAAGIGIGGPMIAPKIVDLMGHIPGMRNSIKRPFNAQEIANDKSTFQRQIPGWDKMSQAQREDIATKANDLGVLAMQSPGMKSGDGSIVSAPNRKEALDFSRYFHNSYAEREHDAGPSGGNSGMSHLVAENNLGVHNGIPSQSDIEELSSGRYDGNKNIPAVQAFGRELLDYQKGDKQPVDFTNMIGTLRNDLSAAPPQPKWVNGKPNQWYNGQAPSSGQWGQPKAQPSPMTMTPEIIAYLKGGGGGQPGMPQSNVPHTMMPTLPPSSMPISPYNNQINPATMMNHGGGMPQQGLPSANSLIPKAQPGGDKFNQIKSQVSKWYKGKDIDSYIRGRFGNQLG